MKNIIYYIIGIALAFVVGSCSSGSADSDSTDSDRAPERPEAIADSTVIQVAKADAEHLLALDPYSRDFEGELLAVKAKESHLRLEGLVSTAKLYISTVRDVLSTSSQHSEAIGLQ